MTYLAYSANWLGSLAYLVRSERPGSSFFLPKGPKKCLLGMLQSYEYLEVWICRYKDESIFQSVKVKINLLLYGIRISF